MSSFYNFQGQAFVPKSDATANNDVGIEQAQPAAILEALGKVRHQEYKPTNEFTAHDLWQNDLAGAGYASDRRDKMGALLGIGYGNAKKFLERLNSYGVTRSEFDEALAKLGAQYG